MNTPFLIRLARVIALLALGVFAFAWPIRFKTEPKALYQPPSELAEADRIMSERWQNGATLTSEERKNIEALYVEHGEAMAEALGLENPIYSPTSIALTLSDVLESISMVSRYISPDSWIAIYGTSFLVFHIIISHFL